MDLFPSKMITFHSKGKSELIVPNDKFGISHVIEKCLCAMFGFHRDTIHVSKDDEYDANDNVIIFVCQVLVIGDLNLEWKANVGRFKIVGENLL